MDFDEAKRLLMGVRKFRSVADMPGPSRRQPLDEQNLKIAFGLMELARRLRPSTRLPGVRKFRSFDEAVRVVHTDRTRDR